MEVCVIGGSGALGSEVAGQLKAKGYTVTSMSRSIEDKTDGIRYARGNARHYNDLYRIAGNARWIFNCINPDYRKWHIHFPGVTENLIRLSKEKGNLIVQADNAYMYQPADLYTEESAIGNPGKKGLVRGWMADRLLHYHQKGDIKAVIVRGGDFFGKGVKQSALPIRSLLNVKNGKPLRLLGNPDCLHTYTYIKDMARAMINLAERPECHGQIWHSPSMPTISHYGLAGIMGNLLNRKIKTRPISFKLIRGLACFSPMIEEMLEIRHLFETPFLLDWSKFGKHIDQSTRNWEEVLSGLLEI